MVVGQKAASALLIALGASWLAGCGEGLGECNQAELGGNATIGMTMPYDGQLIVQSKCASGRCHSADADGIERVGAPAGLNFDVVAASVADQGKMTKAIGTVVDWAEDMWAEIDSGTMPPEQPAGSGELTSAEKEEVRNWLACGAPVIGPDPTAPSATWESIWSALGPTCAGCHGTPGMAGENFVIGAIGDACGSYDNVVGPTGITEMCNGQTLVVPNNPGASQLLLKLKADPAMCGTPMPLGSPNGLVGTTQEPVLQLIETWIMNGAPPPANCP